MKSARTGQHGAVHGHRHGHVLQRNAVEQRAHVVDAVDRDARHADVTLHARMVAVVAAVRGEVEGDREALLAGGDVAAVEGVAVFSRREARVLADGPGLGHVHGGIGTAHIRCDAGPGIEEVEACRVTLGIDGLYGDTFGRDPGFTGHFGVCRGGGCGLEADLGEIRDLGHGASLGFYELETR